MKYLRHLAAILCLPFLFAASLGAAEKGAEATAESKKPSLTYYFFDGWPLCAKITVIVNDQKKKDSSKINFKTVKVGDGDSAKEIKDAKLKGHGIIAKDKDGKVVTTVDGHSYDKKKVEEVIAKLLGTEKKAVNYKKEKKKAA